MIDIGGTHVKILATGQDKRREIESGPTIPQSMVAGVKKFAKDWKYEQVSIGYPGWLLQSPIAEPHNLAHGWVGFRFREAFRRPVKIINDAAMQALGGYKRWQDALPRLGNGPWLTLWSGGDCRSHGTGSTSYRNGTYEDYLGLRG